MEPALNSGFYSVKRMRVFNGAETNCRIADYLGILLMNSYCFAISFQQHSSYVCSDIYLTFPGRDTNPSQVSSKHTLVLIYLPLSVKGLDKVFYDEWEFKCEQTRRVHAFTRAT